MSQVRFSPRLKAATTCKIEPMYAEVALNVPVHGTFHYHIPESLAGQLQIGHLVQVAFRTAQQEGIVIRLSSESDVEKTKPILDILDSRPVVSPQQIDTACWMSQYYWMPLGLCLWLFLPPGLSGRRDIQVSSARCPGREAQRPGIANRRASQTARLAARPPD